MTDDSEEQQLQTLLRRVRELPPVVPEPDPATSVPCPHCGELMDPAGLRLLDCASDSFFNNDL